MASTQPWKCEPTGCFTTASGDVRMLVEEASGGFRVVLTRHPDETSPEEVIATAAASDALTGMTLAEKMVAQLAVQRRPSVPSGNTPSR